MKQKVEVILDGLITAHRIENPKEKLDIKIKERTGKILLATGALALVAISALFLPKLASVTNNVKGRELPIYCVKTAEPKVSLSFDAAWGNEDTGRILEILDKHDVKVTFFMTGGWVEEIGRASCRERV